MVHVRINERETNPNPHINFISALPMSDAESQEEARQLLRALAAQVRPVMKAHGFVVNSLEEYEHNNVFAGRNWNNGEVVELVLRGASGTFLSVSWLMSTLCHELAHNLHLNHGPAFQALWAKLRAEVRGLQSKGYYGDGYWSSGKRLADSTRVDGQSLDPADLPEYVCGGAQRRSRPTSTRRRRTDQAVGPSNRTGAQTAKKRKAGSRVTAKRTFRGSGRSLNEDVSDEDQKRSGAGFRRKAGSKRAKEERALAAERRLKALQGEPSTSNKHQEHESEEGEDDSDVEIVPETDQDRRRAMIDTTAQDDLENLRSAQKDFSSDFIFPQVTSHEDPACDMQTISRRGATAAIDAGPSTSGTASYRGKQRLPSDWSDVEEISRPTPTTKRRKDAGDVPYGSLLQDEMRQRRRESQGLTGSGRRLAGDRIEPTRRSASGLASDTHGSSDVLAAPEPHDSKDGGSEWTCLVCTLSNAPGHLACSACATPLGESK